MCRLIDDNLSVKNDGTGCYYIDKNCSELPTTTCTYGLDGPCHVSNSSCVNTKISDCESVTI